MTESMSISKSKSSSCLIVVTPLDISNKDEGVVVVDTSSINTICDTTQASLVLAGLDSSMSISDETCELDSSEIKTAMLRIPSSLRNDTRTPTSGMSTPLSTCGSTSRYCLDDYIPDEGDETRALIDRLLPPEILCCVFSLLDLVSLCRAACVSKYWNILALDGSLWQHVDFFAFQRAVEPDVVSNISLRSGNFLRSISLRGCEKVDDAALKFFSKKCSGIVCLNVSGCKNLSDETPRALSQNCHMLNVLNMSNCARLTDSTCIFLTLGCSKLQSLDLSWCDEITNIAMKHLSEVCMPLTSLKLCGCSKVDDLGIEYIVAGCSTLNELNIQLCTRFTDAGAISVGKVGGGLRNLCVSQCVELSSIGIRAILEGFPLLETFALAGCALVNDDAFRSLGSNGTGKYLKRLDVEDCHHISDMSMKRIGLHCERLNSLIISYCEGITDSGIGHMARGCQQLQVLECDNCTLLSDETLRYLADVPSLRKVEIYDCRRITSGAVLSFLSSPTGRRVKLRSFYIPINGHHHIVEDETQSSRCYPWCCLL